MALFSPNCSFGNGSSKFKNLKNTLIMVSIEIASKSEQTLLKHYSPKINSLRNIEGEKLSNQGVASVFKLTMITKIIFLLTFTINFFIFIQYFTLFNNKIDTFQALRRCVLLFDRVAITS